MNDIDKKIEELERKIADPDLCRGSAETYTRVTGYYRMTSAFNPGKKQEVIERLEYLIPE
jgi:anaerobic ribonucleoside-triphosphate reductase